MYVMNKQNKQRIQELEYNILKEQYPLVPDHAIARTAWSDKTANGLTKMIVSFIQMSGFQAERVNTMGTYRAAKRYKDYDGNERTIGKGKWTKSGSTPGSADISATIKGRSVKIEVKIGKDFQSEAQKQYQKAIENAGGTYIIAKDFDQFIDWYDNFVKI
jgi:hypothetical protein